MISVMVRDENEAADEIVSWASASRLGFHKGSIHG